METHNFVKLDLFSLFCSGAYCQDYRPPETTEPPPTTVLPCEGATCPTTPEETTYIETTTTRTPPTVAPNPTPRPVDRDGTTGTSTKGGT